MKKIDEITIKKIISVFEKNYVLVPLEIYKDPYKILISTLMSARTNDDTTLTSSKKLFEKANNFVTLNKLTEKEISNLIYPVGFYKTKAKHIKNLTKIILEKHNGQVPQTYDELIMLPGVGRKTANLVLNRAFHKPAIAVDTHVHKISNLLNWVQTKTPEQTEKDLNEIIPQKYWHKINYLFVSIGRQYKSKKALVNFLKENKLI